MNGSQLPPATSLILYQTEDGRTRLECRFEDGTIWLTQALLAELFQTTPQNITLHLKAIFTEDELSEAATCKDYLQVRREGERDVSRQRRHYSLPAILAVGFRVRSPRGTHFRQWATAQLEEYLRKGFVMDDERLKNPNMGLASWSGGAVRQGDVTVAKNFLLESEVGELNRSVVMFLDFAEDQARRRRQVFLKDWTTRLDDFLRFNERGVLPDAGRVSRESADRKAEEEYENFGTRRRAEREAVGAEEAMRELEAAAKALPVRAKSVVKGGGGA